MIWPFKPRMTVDHLASVFARAIEDSSLVYHEAFLSHAAENLKEIDADAIKSEAWIMEMFLLSNVAEEIGAPVLVKSKLLPMVLVGYAPLDNEWYLSREEFYRSKLQGKHSGDQQSLLSSALIEAIRVEFKTTRIDVNEKALQWAISLVIGSSKDGISSLLNSVISKYRII